MKGGAEGAAVRRSGGERPLVSVIVVTYESGELLDVLLAGLRGSDYPSIEILVVDNASLDGGPAALRDEVDVELIESPENLGYGRACNLGAARAKGETLLFLNPDVALRHDTISLLVRDLLGDDGAAIVCASTSEPGVPEERLRLVREVASMNAAAMLVDRKEFERLEGFDPWIFLYWEDGDLCYRAVLAGRRVLRSFEAVADHVGGGSGGGQRWSAEQIKNGLYVHLKLRRWTATALFAGRMAAKTVIRGAVRRDRSVLAGWVVNARELPRTLSKRRALRGGASVEDRARLERLGAEHAYWSRYWWRRGVLRGLRQRAGSLGAPR